jgi:hypothetical protein
VDGKKSRGLHSAVGAVLALAVVLAAGLGVVVPADAAGSPGQGEVTREYEVKAAFLYSFATFIDWPGDAVPDAGDAFIIGVLGTDPFGPVLDAIAASKTVRGKRIVVRRFATLEDYTPCHILFVADSERARMRGVVEKLRDAPVLLVADTEGFARVGGAINLVIEDNKVRFEINQAAAEHAGLKISSKLLRLARLVKTEEES